MTRKQAKEPFAHERWLTPSEVAEAFAVGPKTITRWAKSGVIPKDVVRWTPSGHRRYEEGGIRALLTAGRPAHRAGDPLAGVAVTHVADTSDWYDDSGPERDGSPS